MKLNLEAVHLGWLTMKAMEGVKAWHQKRSEVGIGIKFDHPDVFNAIVSTLTDVGLELIDVQFAKDDTTEGVIYHALPEPYDKLGVSRFAEPHTVATMPEGIRHKYAALMHDRAVELYGALANIPPEFLLEALSLSKAAAEAYETAVNATRDCRVVLSGRNKTNSNAPGDEFWTRRHWHVDMSSYHAAMADALLGDR